MRSPELSPPSFQEGLSDHEMRAILSRDYRLSFKFSQGSESLQGHLFCLLGVHYVARFGDTHISLLNTITNWDELAAPPYAHGAVSLEHIERESNNEAMKFRETLTDPELPTLIDDPRLYMTLANTTLHLLLAREEKYLAVNSPVFDYDGSTRNRDAGVKLLNRGRPKRPEPIRYSSMFKKYAIDKRSTGSDAFDTIFQDMRMLVDIWRPPAFDTLAAYWERHHPNEDFYAGYGQASDTPPVVNAVEVAIGALRVRRS